MIHHISIAAQNPQHVAGVLAELFQGKAVPFPHNPGSYMAVAVDKDLACVQVYPLGTQIIPGSGQRGCTFEQNPQPVQFTAFHASIFVPIGQAEIEKIGAREGWRVVRCRRAGLVDEIEFWVENRLMLELVPPELTDRFLAVARDPNVLKQLLGETVAEIA
ncbi:hypothetical protein [Altericista sp. CCNU0014]|uniref:hypothetical protein n=1 Tax=Altericista sp. CCNU0014 TaxID=3082949 RepID=UPI00384CDF50